MPFAPLGTPAPQPRHVSRASETLRTAARRMGIGLALCAILMGASACRPERPSGSASSHPQNIVVSAAVSLENAFGEIARLYTAQTGTKVDFSFGGSGELEKQIEAGAPVDVFASAGAKEMDELQAQGLIVVSSRTDFAGNSLVLVVPADSKLGLASFPQLAEPRVKRIAIGNPQTVPAGLYARQSLRHLHLWSRLHPRLIFAEDVRQALDYVMRDEVNAGIVYSTDVPIAHGKVTIAAQAPEGSYGPVLYPIARVKGCSHPEAAESFIRLVLSRQGKGILSKYGFRSVK
ncbi:MAG TPA: molybdate ABC transporter substrate-binding protein [Terriglobia bacterium]|nr:molybdate ABC transporter substrate-binding protein [Terriglobia bacterium]